MAGDGGGGLSARRLELKFDDAASTRWLAANAWLSHVGNALGLLMPAGEAFVVRTVGARLGDVNDAALEARVRGLLAQEQQHARAHASGNRWLERCGVQTRSLQRIYHRLAFGMLEPRVPRRLRLAVAVGLEHGFASLAEGWLSSDLLDRAEPEMARLLRWHAAEELEHRSVAFDVFVHTGGTYPERVLGHLMATVLFLGFWAWASRRLFAQEGLSLRARWRVRAEARRIERECGSFAGGLWRGVLRYWRPSFHPESAFASSALRGQRYLEAEGIA